MEKLVVTNSNLPAIKNSLIDGLTIASGAKSSSTYYHTKDEQMKAIKDAISAMYGLSKELPLIIACQKGVTGRFASEVLLNEFVKTANGGACNIVNPLDWYDNGLSDKALLGALKNLGENGITYVLRLFMDMKENHVNNERARKIILGYIWGQLNIEFYALKYRNKLAEVLRHVYGVRKTSVLISIAEKVVFNMGLYGNAKELNIVNENILQYTGLVSTQALAIFLFIFKKDGFISFGADLPLLCEYRRAKTDITKIKLVPEEVLIGLISSTSHPQYQKLWSTKERRQTTKALIRHNVEVTSVNQQVRQTKSTAKLGVEKVVNLEAATDFLALYKTGYETEFTMEILSAINKLAAKSIFKDFPYQTIGIIVDKSISMSGSVESKNTPRAVVDFTARVLMASAKNTNVVETDGDVTDIATSFIKLVSDERATMEYDAIFILTDGYENAYEGLTDEVIAAFLRVTGRVLPIFQISPITGAEMGANVRKLGSGVITMAVNNPAAIMPQVNARLLEIDTKRWLENQVRSLEAANVSRNKSINS